MNLLFKKPAKVKFNFRGFLGERLKINEKEWLLKALDANPAITQIFHQRDIEQVPNLDVWSGEYPGKFLTGAVLCWRISLSSSLENVITWLIKKLSEAQDDDGYLGPFNKKERFFGKIKKFIRNDWIDVVESNTASDIQILLKKITKTPIYETGVCDLWGHYHCMLGLWLWYLETGDKLAFNICTKAAGLICSIFLDSKKNVCDTGSSEFNMAVIHIFCLMYKETKQDSYLKMINKIEEEWGKKDMGDYLNSGLRGKDFFETNKPRWESLHSIQALAELYYITGDDKYRKVFEHYYWSIANHDRHNTGGFSSGEKATGNPYGPLAIETCATVAWIAMGIDMLYLTGNSVVADEIELSTLNAMLGSQAPSGRWWTYNTPMDGYRKSFYHDANWQCLPGGPELNCCYTSGAKGLGMLSEWAFMQSDNEIYLNYYGPGTFQLKSPSGQCITIKQKTDYPKTGNIKIHINLQKSDRFILKIRIPRWSGKSKIEINGNKEKNIKTGSYHSINRVWENGDTINIGLDMALHFWNGQKQLSGKTSIYYGPILLTYDKIFNDENPEDVQIVDVNNYKKIEVKNRDHLSPWILQKFSSNSGKDIILCDFASAGIKGTYYKSWIKIANLKDYISYFA